MKNIKKKQKKTTNTYNILVRLPIRLLTNAILINDVDAKSGIRN